MERYPKLMYSNFDYYDYKGNCSFPSSHFIRNIEKVIGKLLENPRNHPEPIYFDFKAHFILA
jgi:hypothetical protein